MRHHLHRRWRVFAATSLGVVAFSAVPAASAMAQGGKPPGREVRGSSTRGNDRGREIEQQLQHRIAAMLKERLSLTDEQVKRLEGVTLKLERERRHVRGEEYRVRMGLRAQLLAKDSASNDSVAVLLDRLPAIERQKIDLMVTEQRELAQFLTPVQRARYMAFQDEIRRNMDRIRSGRDSSSSDRSSMNNRRPSSPTEPSPMELRSDSATTRL